MRWTMFGLLVVAACGGGNDDGAVLVVRAPGGPVATDRLEIILASADASAIIDVGGQRAKPTALDEHEARYYMQRSTAGAVENIPSVDGFVVRIEPNSTVNPDEEFIPFLITHDRIDGVFVVTGIGAVLDANGDPAPVVIASGRTEQYVVDMIDLELVSDDVGIDAGDGMVIECARDQGTYRSGIAWQPPGGAQLRLMLPDLVADPEATDASTRLLDLDCDRHEAIDHDCDDLRALFNDDSTEVCDGFDTNCDGERLITIGCDLGPGVCGPGGSRGVQVCRDTNGNGSTTTCSGDPQCQCTTGNPGTCTKCVLDFSATADVAKQAPCAPAEGKLFLGAYGCSSNTPCVVEVVNQGPWIGRVSLTNMGFSSKVTDVTGDLHLEASLRSGTEVMGAPATSVGSIFLAITPAGGSAIQVGVDLQLASTTTADCDSPLAQMQCSP